MTQEEIMIKQQELEASMKVYQEKVDQYIACKLALETHQEANLPSTYVLIEKVCEPVKHNLFAEAVAEHSRKFFEHNAGHNVYQLDPAKGHLIHQGLIKQVKTNRLKDYLATWATIASITVIATILGGAAWFLATTIHPIAGIAFVFLGIFFLAYHDMD